MLREFRQQDHLVYHIETGYCVGRAVPLKNGKGFSVHRTMTLSSNERDKIGVVKAMNEALPMVTDYYERNRPQWQCMRDGQYHPGTGYTMYTEYRKWSAYGVFRVKQQDDGLWVATRTSKALLREGEVASFSTAEVARHVVDLHERDGFGNFPAIYDGYSWDGPPFLGPGAWQPNG
jgi:hypothetical protein